MNETSFEKNAGQAAAFQKIWAETWSRIIQACFSISPEPPPPELLGQIRSGIFQALAKSWDEFLRSDEFQETMRQWMEQAITFRKLSNEVLARSHNELQSPSRDDIDTVMLAMRHLENRLLDRMQQMTDQLKQLGDRLEPRRQPRPANKRAQTKSRKSPMKSKREKGKLGP